MKRRKKRSETAQSRRVEQAAKSESTQPEILEFLENQSSEGAYQSSGVFTIDTKLAARKLAAFQLPSLESWVLVLVQAAHRCGAAKVTVTPLPRQTSVTFFGGATWSWDELRAVLDGESTTRPDLFSLAVAVRALTGQDGLRGFRVIAPDLSAAVWRDQKFRLDGAPAQERMFTGKLFEKGAVFEVYHTGKLRQVNSFFRAFFEQRGDAREEQAAILTALARDCLASAVPLWCDGRRIAGLHLGPPPPAHHHRRPLALLVLEDGRVPAANFSAAMEWKASSVEGMDLSIPGWQSPAPRPCAALVMVSATFIKERSKAIELAPGASQLLWVQDGVVVHREPIAVQGTLGVTVVASAGGLKTDLSGLVLVQDRQLDERRTWIQEKVRTGLTELAKQSHEGVRVDAPWAERTSALYQAVTFLNEIKSLGAIFGLSDRPKRHTKLKRESMERERVRAQGKDHEAEHWDRKLDEELKSLAKRVSSGFPAAKG